MDYSRTMERILSVIQLTDITEFALPESKLYLSSIIDCSDGLVVNWTVGRSPNAALVNTMLEQAIFSLPKRQHPIIHTDRYGRVGLAAWSTQV